MKFNLQQYVGNLIVHPDTRIGIVASEFNPAIVNHLLQDTLATLFDHSVTHEAITVIRVPGAYELGFAARQLATNHDVIIALGAVIRGETPHFDYVCQACVQSLNDVMQCHNIPIVFGVLTTNTVEQAWARAKGQAVSSEDKHPQGGGITMAENALRLIDLAQQLRKPKLL